MSNFINAFVLGAITGGCLGVIIMALLTMSKVAALKSECMTCELREWKKNYEK